MKFRTVITRLGFTALSTIALSGAIVSASAEISEKDFSAAMAKFLASDKGQEQMLTFLESLQQKQQELARKKQIEMTQQKLEEQFKNPVKVDVGTSPVTGPADAAITLIEFSDFQCPYCKKGKEVVESVQKAYPGKVKVVFKHLPLPFHPQAKPAAAASIAAGNQGKFWEFYEALFTNQDKLKPEFYEETAKKLGLNMERWKKDLEAPATEAQIKADTDQAQKLGIGGTPSFVVNGIEIRGAYPLDHFKTIIDRLLAQKK